jgi:hypothetical protein
MVALPVFFVHIQHRLSGLQVRRPEKALDVLKGPIAKICIVYCVEFNDERGLHDCMIASISAVPEAVDINRIVVHIFFHDLCCVTKSNTTHTHTQKGRTQVHFTSHIHFACFLHSKEVLPSISGWINGEEEEEKGDLGPYKQGFRYSESWKYLKSSSTGQSHRVSRMHCRV